MKKTPLKKKNSTLSKKISLKSNKGLKGFSVLKTKQNLKQKIVLKSKNVELEKTTELKKQNEKSKEKWERVRNQVLERDNHKCIVCGKPATQVHHIHLRSKRKDLMYEMNNLVSLCNDHHRHSSIDGLERVNRRIAEALHITLEELLKFAETKKDE